MHPYADIPSVEEIDKMIPGKGHSSIQPKNPCIRTDKTCAWRGRSTESAGKRKSAVQPGNAAQMPTAELTEEDFENGEIDILTRCS